MRFRTLALALALSFGITGGVQAAAKKPAVRSAKRQKFKKSKPGKKFKQSNAGKVKPRKAKKVKRASR
jgi:hypothetical protein